VGVAMYHKAKKMEEFTGHRLPFGYRWDSTKKIFIPIEEELKIVKKCFDLYLNGKFDPIIETKKGWINTVTGKKLIGREIQRHKTLYAKNGHSFRSIAKTLNLSHTSVKYYLNNIFYAGYDRYMHLFRKINGGFRSVISREEWNNAQKKMRSCSRCKDYKPLLIPETEPDFFSLTKEQRKSIPIINRAKHNYYF
jgi:DNA-binding CsgD family transcriptional regulator